MGNSLSNKVQAAIDDIRPFLIADGGDIELVEITTDNIVRVRLLGACGSCSMSPMTCLLYTSPSPRDLSTSRMPSSA